MLASATLGPRSEPGRKNTTVSGLIAVWVAEHPMSLQRTGILDDSCGTMGLQRAITQVVWSLHELFVRQSSSFSSIHCVPLTRGSCSFKRNAMPMEPEGQRARGGDIKWQPDLN